MNGLRRGLCLLIILSASNAIAQNTYPFPSSGPVGIGTTTPAYPLDVHGAIAINGDPVIDETSVSVPSDGTYVIASNGRIHGEYILTFDSAGNRVQTVHVLVNADQYDTTSTLQILENHSYAWNWAGAGPVMTNFRLLLSADGGTVYLVMAVGNRNGGTLINVQYQGAADNQAAGAHWGGTLAGTETSAGVIGLASLEGNIGIGTTTPGADLASLATPPSSSTPIFEVNGDIALAQNSGGQIIMADGTVQSTAWNGVLTGGDYAESVNVSGDRQKYEPGDVLVIDPASEGSFLKSSQPYSTAVTGIYSTRPGVVGRRQLTARSQMKEEVPMAMTGIVPTKVSAENGPIKPGDLLVTSSKSGYAMKGTDRTQMLGAVIGKAIGHLDAGTGVIEAVVTLQ